MPIGFGVGHVRRRRVPIVDIPGMSRAIASNAPGTSVAKNQPRHNAGRRNSDAAHLLNRRGDALSYAWRGDCNYTSPRFVIRD